jgi:kynureninase
VDAAAYRDRFPILAETTYLINHSLAAMPAAAEDRLAEYARMWRTRGIRSWGEGWWEMPLTVGDQVGRIVGARPGTTCMHQNVTVAVAVVLSCFRLESQNRTTERSRIVYLEDEFPSVRYLLQAQPGAEIEVVPDLDALVEAIDERTLLVPLSHVLFKTAELQDVEAVQRRAEEAGAHVLLDAYQSAGAVPLDLDALGVAFATGGSVKWLCGGPGAGWLYVRPDLIARLEPAFVGWQAHARPFAFEPELEYADGIARFLSGTPNIPALYAATAGYDVIEEVGVDAIRERSLGLTDLLIRLADDAAFEVTSQRDQARRGASVTVRTPGFEGVHSELAERQILCDFRPDVGLRLGPHFFNTEDELEYAVGQIAEIVASGVHERHVGAAARF